MKYMDATLYKIINYILSLQIDISDNNDKTDIGIDRDLHIDIAINNGNIKVTNATVNYHNISQIYSDEQDTDETNHIEQVVHINEDKKISNSENNTIIDSDINNSNENNDSNENKENGEETWDDINAKANKSINDFITKDSSNVFSIKEPLINETIINKPETGENNKPPLITNVVEDNIYTHSEKNEITTVNNINNDGMNNNNNSEENNENEDKELQEYLDKWNNKKEDKDDDEWVSLEELQEKKKHILNDDISQQNNKEENIENNNENNSKDSTDNSLNKDTFDSIASDNNQNTEEELEIDFGPGISQDSIENNTNNTENNKDNRYTDNDSDNDKENLSDEEKQKREAEYIAKLEKEYHRREFPEETLPEFEEVECLIKDNDKYQATPMMHAFTLAEDADPEYDKYVNPHYAYISDFFPVNNQDANRLIRTIRKIKNENIDNASAEDIYKYWLLYLKEHGGDYQKYDWRNYNDLGEFIGREDQKLNDTVLDDYINTVNGQTVMYDEAADKVKAEEEFQAKVKQILESGQYNSDVDPELSHMFVKNKG